METHSLPIRPPFYHRKRFLGYCLLIIGFVWLSVSTFLLHTDLLFKTSDFVREGLPRKATYQRDEVDKAVLDFSKKIQGGLPWIFTPALLMLVGGLLVLDDEPDYIE